MSSRPLSAIVLAAGGGTRMKSSRPKPLHMLCGRPLVFHVLDALAELDIDRVGLVVGHGAERVIKTLTEKAPANLALEFVEQTAPRGTGDATAVGLTGLPDDDDDGDVVVLPGDTPLLRAPTLAALVRAHRAADAAATVMTARIDRPTGYGRIVRGKNDNVVAIVEESDATADERAIDEINTGFYVFRRSVLAPALRRISPDNEAGEYYLTDVIAVLAEAGYRIATMEAEDPSEGAGVNDRAQLAAAEAELRARTNERWMRRGVTMVDPEQTYLDASVELAEDVTLFPGTVLQGHCRIGAGAEIGPSTRLVDCAVGEGATVENTVARDSTIGAGAHVGPYAVLTPGAHVADGAVTGPFFTAGDDEGDAP
jgi:bifunctional UDP-N-acetylglucosamine pyrophosphorylase / glucosamine-1-phosphate N-acetyltransferase